MSKNNYSPCPNPAIADYEALYCTVKKYMSDYYEKTGYIFLHAKHTEFAFAKSLAKKGKIYEAWKMLIDIKIYIEDTL